MKMKENAGCDPITISRGFTKLDGNPPYSGESVTNPRHVAEEKRVEKMMAEFQWPDMKEGDHGPEGFLGADLPDPYMRPQRSKSEDRG